MSKVYSNPWSADCGTKALNVSVLNSADLALLSETSGEVVETTTYSPLNRPEKWTFASKKVADVYKDKGISPSAIPITTAGVQIMVRHDAVVEVTDDADASYIKELPFSAWTCVKLPVNELVTETQVLTELQRALAGLFGDNADVSSARIADLIRGALRADN